MKKVKLPDTIRQKKESLKGKMSQSRLCKIDTYKYEKYALPGHIVLAMLLNLLVETLSRHSLIRAVSYMTGSPAVFLYNAFLIFTTLGLAFLFRRRNLARFLISALWITLGTVNCVVLGNRVTPFNRADLKVAMDAVTLLNQYFKWWQIVLIAVLITVGLVIVAIACKTARKYKGRIHRLVSLGLFGLNVVVLLFVTQEAVNKRVISDYFGNIAFAYEDYGFPYCFTCGCLNIGIDEPNGYSEEAMEEIVDDGALTVAKADRDTFPNIIMIQLESFFDPSEVEWLELSEDPIPTFRSLMAEYSGGYFKVPSVGAGTANTEFEVLTGMNMRYFGPGEYPYKTVMKTTTCESVASALENFGYGTHAMHNNGGNFYSRSTVFGNMGFDDYTSKEFMNILQFTPMGWAKDDILTDYITEALDSTEQQDLVFTITVQSHGSYPEEQVLTDPRIRVTGIKDESKKYSWEYYVNQLYEVDRFIANLLNELEKRDEDTVLVLYGDHLPTMGLETEDLACRYLYNTEYVIWDNMGLEKQDENLYAYQLVAELFDRLDIHAGTVFNYHQERRKSKSYLSDLEMLQYDLLYGEQYAYTNHEVSVTNHMEMGLYDAVIEQVSVSSDGKLKIKGDGFTSWSKIYINGEKIGTRFWNDKNIESNSEVSLESGDVITVCQVGSKSTIFRSTKEYIYEAPEEPKESDTEQSEETKSDEKGEENDLSAGL